MGFPRQGYWSGLPFPSSTDLPYPGIKPASSAMAGRFFTSEPHREKKNIKINWDNKWYCRCCSSKQSTCQCRKYKRSRRCLQCRRSLGSIPGSERSLEERNGNPLQYSWLKNYKDSGASRQGCKTAGQDWACTHCTSTRWQFVLLPAKNIQENKIILV